MRLLRALAVLVLGLTVLAAGCGSDSCAGGAGPIVSQTLDLSGFTGFDFQVGGDVTVVPGNTQQVVVRSQQNVIDSVNRDVINGIWEIGYTRCVEGINEFSIEIALPELDSVELSGAGTIIAETQASTIDTFLSGAGTVTLSGEATSQQVILEGSGTVEAFDLMTEETTVLLTGQGTVNVSASEQLSVDLSGAGAVAYKGDPQLDVRITGVGSLIDAN
ncbi:MAG: GIN domain-containing protein [Polyangiales bacterium]